MSHSPRLRAFSCTLFNLIPSKEWGGVMIYFYDFYRHLFQYFCSRTSITTNKIDTRNDNCKNIAPTTAIVLRKILLRSLRFFPLKFQFGFGYKKNKVHTHAAAVK